MLLTLIHRRVPDRATLLNVSAGWHMHLDISPLARQAGSRNRSGTDGVGSRRNTTGGYRPDGPRGCRLRPVRGRSASTRWREPRPT